MIHWLPRSLTTQLQEEEHYDFYLMVPMKILRLKLLSWEKLLYRSTSNGMSKKLMRKGIKQFLPKVEGAVAAPTAGLHFSRQLLKRLELKGVDMAEITLHVGLGTFRPVEVEDLTKHKMDSEQASITQEAADLVNVAKRNKKRVCAIGTTDENY